MQVIKHDIAKKRVGGTNKRLGRMKGLKTSRRPTMLRSVTEASLKAEANCPRCDSEQKLRHREFSAQAISALLVWGEIAERVVGVPICEGCYDELREVLIERNEEINNPKPDRQPVVAKQVVNAKTAPVAKQAPVKETKEKEAVAAKGSASTKAAKEVKEKEAKGKKAPPPAKGKAVASAKSKNTKTVAAPKKKVKKAS